MGAAQGQKTPAGHAAVLQLLQTIGEAYSLLSKYHCQVRTLSLIQFLLFTAQVLAIAFGYVFHRAKCQTCLLSKYHCQVCTLSAFASLCCSQCKFSLLHVDMQSTGENVRRTCSAVVAAKFLATCLPAWL